MTKKIILIGGGEHCKMVISVLKELNEFEIMGIVDKYKPIGASIMNIKIIGRDKDLDRFYRNGIQYALITIGSIKDNLRRARLFNTIKEIGYNFPVVISPQAIVNKTVQINEGTVVMPGCIINVDVLIGKNCIINTGAIIEHGCKIGNHCHIAPGAHVSGGVEIGDLSFIGIGSSIVQGIIIRKNVVIGAGSVIIENIEDNVIVAGNPARIIKKVID